MFFAVLSTETICSVASGFLEKYGIENDCSEKRC